MTDFFLNLLRQAFREDGERIVRELLINSLKAFFGGIWSLIQEYPWIAVICWIVLIVWLVRPVFLVVGTIKRWLWGREKKKLDRQLGIDMAELLKLQREQNALLRQQNELLLSFVGRQGSYRTPDAPTETPTAKQ